MPTWPLKRSYFWQQAPFFRLLLPLLAAIICYDRSWLPSTIQPLWLLIGCLVCFVSAGIIRKQFAALKAVTFLSLQLMVFCFGWWLCRKHDLTQERRWFARSGTMAQAYLATVMDAPAEKERIWRIPVRLTHAIDTAGPRGVCGLAILNCYKDSLPTGIRKGDLLLVPPAWQPIKNAGNPFEFDYAAYCRRKHILHQQFCAKDRLIIYRQADTKVNGLIERCHLFCQRQLDRYVTDSISKGILQAMLLGDEEGFDPSLRQAYAETGVVHIVSISGSHVGVLFFIVTLLLFWLKGKKGQLIRYLAGLAAIWLYVLMAGAPPSAIRSAVMFSIVALSILTGKQSHPLNTLLAAGFILLTANPMWLFAVGFQLSFCAVLGLVLFFRPLFLAWPQTSAVGRWLWTAVSASICAELLTAPLAIYYFHSFPLFFIIANVLAAVLLGIIALVGGMGIIAFCWAPPVARGIGFVITRLIRLFNYLILHIQGGSPDSFTHLRIGTVALILIYAGITAFAYYLILKRKPALFIGLALSCLLVSLLINDKYRALRQHRLVVYNSGRHSRVEEIRGHHFNILGLDTAPNKMTDQAHNGWHAWRCAPATHGDYFRIKNRNILLLKHPATADTCVPFPVDILIADYSLKHGSARRVKEIFHPKILVASSLQPRWVLQQWADSCRTIGQPFHAVAYDGAFVFE